MCLDAAVHSNSEKEFWKSLMINLRYWLGDSDPGDGFVLKGARAHMDEKQIIEAIRDTARDYFHNRCRVDFKWAETINECLAEAQISWKFE